MKIELKSKNILIGIVVCVCVFFVIMILGGEKSKKVYYNNYDINSTAIKRKGTYYLPLNEVVEQVHFKVSYDESTKTIKVYDNVNTATINNNAELMSDGVVVDTKCVTIVKDDKTYVPLSFFSNGLGFDVSETKDTIELYGKNMYILSDVDDNNEESNSQQLYVYSKDFGSGEKARIPLPAIPKTGTDARLSVYRTKNENDVIEYYKYNGENVYPTVATYYNTGYLAMEYDHEGMKSYDDYWLFPDNIKPTQEDFDYYAKPLEDRMAVDGDMIAFVDLVSSNEKNRIKIWDDSKFDENYSYPMYIEYNMQDYFAYKFDHSPLDRIVRLTSMKDNQLKCAVRTIADDRCEVRESILTVTKDGSVMEELEKSKNSVKVMYNGEELELGNPGAITIDDSIYIPLRAFSQELGYEVVWDMYTSTANIKNGTDEIYIDMNGNTIINGVRSVTDRMPKKIEGSAYVPLKFVFEVFGIGVSWNKNTNIVDMVG